jgi:aarF domain-containing kinase
MLRRKLFSAAGSTIFITAGVGLYASKDEGTQRSLIFWANIFPIYLHYRGIQFLDRDINIIDNKLADKLYNECHERYTNKVRDLTFKMRGFYLKQAQLMSMQDDFVPPAYMTWVKATQDNVPSEFESPGKVREYVAFLCRAELGREFDDIFRSWDDTPLGVASIGQVHRAVLKESGKEVAVKILVPGIESKFKSDIHTLKSFCKLAMPQYVTSFDEIEKQFLTEFDYTREAENLKICRQNTLARWNDQIEIPEPHSMFCSKHLLVMDYLNGIRLVDGIRNQYRNIAKLSGKTLEEIEYERKSLVENGSFRFKTIEEEKSERYYTQWAVFLSDVYNKNALRFLYNISPLSLLYGYVEYEWTELPIDLGHTLDMLAKIQAENIFYDGFFNGDAHPGNILLLQNGKIGLIDYGQVKSMTVEERIKYAKLVIAHSRMDKSEVIRITFNELGMITKYKRPDIAYLHSAFWNDRTTVDVMGDKNIATFIDWLEAEDPMILLPEEYIFASRSSLMLRGMGKAFGLNLVMSKLWVNDAKEFLKSQGIKY